VRIKAGGGVMKEDWRGCLSKNSSSAGHIGEAMYISGVTFGVGDDLGVELGEHFVLPDLSRGRIMRCSLLSSKEPSLNCVLYF